jgi:hypothetical protein
MAWHITNMWNDGTTKYNLQCAKLCTKLRMFSSMPIYCQLPNHCLGTQCMLAYLDTAACLAWLVVLEICTNTVFTITKECSRMKYVVEQKIFIYDTFVQYSSWRKCQRKFHRKYTDSTVPRKTTIYNITRKLCSMWLVLDKNKSQKRPVLTEENLHNINSNGTKPKEVIMSFSSSVWVGKKFLKLSPYETMVVHSLLPPDSKARIRYCR